MHTAYQVLKILSLGSYISGEMVAKRLNISRARVWQAVNYLRASGLEIFATPGRGYRLPEPVELLDPSLINQLVLENNPEHSIKCEVFHQLGSTNDYLLDAIKRNIFPGHVTLCEEQTQGRGRQGKTWYSPLAKNISMSLYWRMSREAPNLPSLSLVVGICVIKALFKILGPREDLGLKWPNDIWYQDKKVCGILIETKPSVLDSNSLDIIIGLGCNTDSINYMDNRALDGNSSISLEEIYQKKISRNLLIADILSELMTSLITFSQEGFKPFISEWKNFDLLKDRCVTLRTAKNQILLGNCLGVNESGALCIDHNGQRKAFLSGEVSVRPYATVS